MRKITKIVVDADVARCAGGSEAPTSSNARKLLLAMEQYNVKLVNNEQLRSEWRVHASKFSTRWLATMTSKRLVERLPENGDFEDYSGLLEAVQLTEGEMRAGLKDCHLLSAAHAVQALIASNDRAAFAVFHKASQSDGRFGTHYWASPTLKAEEILPYMSHNQAVPTDWQIRDSDHHCLI